MATLLTEPRESAPPLHARMPPAPSPPVEKSARLVSLDAYRGFIMLAMASSAFTLAGVVRKLYPADGPPLADEQWKPFWQLVAYNASHVEWVGCGFWDLIQPSFMFMVGVAIPYSYASRKARGDSDGWILVHTVWRAVLLVLLGVFLTSTSTSRTNWIFPSVLCQIGLGYVFVYLFRGLGMVVQLLGITVILVGYWAFFAFWPLPPEGFDLKEYGLEKWNDWLPGFFAHWNKSVNPANYFDRWFLNLGFFSRTTEFKFNDGGYQTLNFVPSMATMVLGLMAGELLRGEKTRLAKFGVLMLAGAVCLALGLLAGATICPIVKKIWTPSWAPYSAGWTFWMLAAFYLVIDIWEWKSWAFPFVVVGMNSIAMYVMAQLLPGWIIGTLRTHFRPELFKGLYGLIPEPYDAVAATPLERAFALFVLWLICLWMYRRKLFLRL